MASQPSTRYNVKPTAGRRSRRRTVIMMPAAAPIQAATSRLIPHEGRNASSTTGV